MTSRVDLDRIGQAHAAGAGSTHLWSIALLLADTYVIWSTFEAWRVKDTLITECIAFLFDGTDCSTSTTWNKMIIISDHFVTLEKYIIKLNVNYVNSKCIFNN